MLFIDAQRNTFNCRPAWQICCLGLRKMTLQSAKWHCSQVRSLLFAEQSRRPSSPVTCGLSINCVTSWTQEDPSYPSFQVLVLINFICMVLRYLEMALFESRVLRWPGPKRWRPTLRLPGCKRAVEIEFSSSQQFHRVWKFEVTSNQEVVGKELISCARLVS